MPTKHTQTPWEVGQSNLVFIGTNVSDPLKQSVIAQIYGHREQALVDAAHIVRAVNAHEGLVDALELLLHDRTPWTVECARAALSAAKE